MVLTLRLGYGAKHIVTLLAHYWNLGFYLYVFGGVESRGIASLRRWWEAEALLPELERSKAFWPSAALMRLQNKTKQNTHTHTHIHP